MLWLTENMTIDKYIHRDEFKLRVLLTNTCNLNCKFCLNDFQEKNKNDFLDFNIFEQAVSYYINVVKNFNYSPQIYLSGGEPTIHPNIKYFLEIKKYFPESKLILCTNGMFKDYLIEVIRKNVDEMHFSIYPENYHNVLEKLNYFKNPKLQCVYTKLNPYVTVNFLKNIIIKYPKINLKVFNDFHERYQDRYINFKKECDEKLGKDRIQFRYTGVQENRGPGCKDCKQKCVTLKGVWIFPNGKITPCPQKKRFFNEINYQYFQECFYFHKV